MKKSQGHLADTYSSYDISEGSANDAYPPYVIENVRPNGQSIRNFKVCSGQGLGIAFSGHTINVYPEAYGHLRVGKTETVVVSLTVVDNFGAELPKVVVFTIQGTRKGPQVSCALTGKTRPSESIIAFDMLQ